MRNSIFFFFEAQRNSAIVERNFRTQPKHNVPSAIKFTKHNANSAFFAILDGKGVSNLLKKIGI